MEPFLGFTSAWMATGVIALDDLTAFARYAANDPEKSPRHWRWVAFRDFAEEHVPLSADQCLVLFHLGECEPDFNLGTAIMCGVLYQPACPDEVLLQANASDRGAVRRLAAHQAARKSVAVRDGPAKPRPSV